MVSKAFDVEAGVKEINQFLMEKGFMPRDADGADFQRDGDASLRFKTGTVYGEVTVTIWRNDRQGKQPIRILSEGHMLLAKAKIDELVMVQDLQGGFDA